MSNKNRAVTCTASKTIITVDLAANILSEAEMDQLSKFVDKLVEWDKKNKGRN